MKVLHVIDTLNTGGSEKICIALIKLLLDAGHQTDCMVISSKGALFEEIDKRAGVILLNRKNKYSIFKMYKCSKYISGYDIVHIHMRHTWAYVKLSCLIFKRHPKMVFHDHFGSIAINRNPTYRLKGLLKPVYYIGVSNELTDWAFSELKIKESNIFLLENTILPDYSRSDKYSGDWVMVANLRPVKNLHFAIKLAETMKRKLVIFGNSDGSEYAAKIIKMAGNTEYVKIVSNEANIQKYLNNFKIAIHTAFSETGPLVLMEYLAHGIPFVTHNTGEVVSQIREELPELVVSTFEQEKWIEKIIILESKIKTEGEILKNKLENIFHEKFSPQKYIDKCLKIYQNVLTS